LRFAAKRDDSGNRPEGCHHAPADRIDWNLRLKYSDMVPAILFERSCSICQMLENRYASAFQEEISFHRNIESGLARRFSCAPCR
jgi:hypothetical protein